MKSLFTLSRISFIGAFVCLLASFHVNAQVTGYTQTISNGTYTPVSGAGVVSMNVTGSWLAVGGASSGGSSDAVNFASWNESLDEVVMSTTGFGFPIGFNFQYGGRTFDRFAIGSSGHITLGTSKQPFATGRFSYNSVNPGNASGPLGIYTDNGATPSDINIQFDRSLRALSHSLIPNVGATVKYQVTGTAPNRMLTVEWANFARSFLTIDNINFQIKLNENGNTFAYVYGPMTLSVIANAYHNQCQVGFRGVTREFLNNSGVVAQNQRLVINGTGSVAWGVASTTAVNGTFAMDFRSTNFPASGLTYTWTPPAFAGCGPKGSVIGISLSGTTANLTWSAAAFGSPTNYEIDIRANGSAGAFTAVTGSPFSGTSASITGLASGSSYECRMRTNCGGTFSGYETFVISIPGPGENCALALGPVSIAANQAGLTYTTVTAGNTQDGPASCAGGSPTDDIWYTFTAPSDGSSVILTTAQEGTFDNDWVMEVFDGCTSGTPGNLIACNDDQVAGVVFSPEVKLCQFEYINGQTYYVRLYTWSGTAAQQIKFGAYKDVACPIVPANNECVNATLVNLENYGDCPSNATTFTTENATPSAGQPSASCDPTTKNDVFIKFNTGVYSSVLVNVSLVTATQLGMQVMSSCGGSQVFCANPAAGFRTISGLTPGQDYYIRFWSNNSSVWGTFNVCLQQPGTCPGDLGGIGVYNVPTVGASTPYTASGRTTCGSGDQLTSTLVSSTCGSGTYLSGEDDVYIFDVDSPGLYNISVSSTNNNLGIRLFNGCPLAGNSGLCVNSAQSSSSNQLLLGLNLSPGNTYYLVVDKALGSCILSYDVTIEASQPPSANDNCAGATLLTQGAVCSYTSDSYNPANTNSAAPSCSGISADADDDQWFKFVATSADPVITVNPSSGYTPVLQLYGSCGGPSLCCVSAGSVGAAITMRPTSALTPGNTYFLRVYDFFTGPPATVDFDICVADVQAPTANCVTCPGLSTAEVEACGAASNNTFGTAEVATLGGTVCAKAFAGCNTRDIDWFRVTTTAAGYITATVNAEFPMVMQLIGSDGATVLASTNIPTECSGNVSLTNPTSVPAGNYFLLVAVNQFTGYPCGSVRNDYIFNTSFSTTPPPAPANDNCSGAIALTPCGSATTASTLSATQSVAPITCGGFTGAAALDVWFKFTANATQHVITANGNFNGVMQVFGDYCGGPNVACSDANVPSVGTETLNLATIVGRTYFIRYYALATVGLALPGNFSIQVSTPGGWSGNTSSNWNAASNWCSGIVPTAAADILIPNVTNDPVMNVSGSCRNLTMGPGASLTLTPGNLTVTGSVTAVGSGISTSGTGQLILGGTTANTLTGNMSVQNMQVSNTNPGGFVVSSGSNLNVGGVMSMGANARLNATGNVTILSNATQEGSISPVPSTSSLLGTNYIIQRYIPFTAPGWHFMGASVTGNNFGQWADDFQLTSTNPVATVPGAIFSPEAERSTIFRFVESVHNFKLDTVQKDGWRIPNSTSIVPGVGYRVYMKPSFFANNPSYIVENVGAVQVGNAAGGGFSFPSLIRNEYSPCYPTDPSFNPTVCNESNRGWNLVANPFPSNINWDAAGWTKPAAMNNAFFIWNGILGGYRVYVAGSPGTSLGAVGASALTNPNLIPKGQAFFVKVTSGNGVSLTLKADENVKNPGSATFVRSAVASNDLRLRISKVGDAEYNFDAMVRFMDGATDGFDQHKDAHFMRGNRESVAFRVGDQDMILNSLPALDGYRVVPVRSFYSGQTGQFKFDFLELSSFPASVHIYLKDRVLNSIVDVRQYPSYTFNVAASNNLNSNDRFELVFSPTAVTEVKPSVNGTAVFSIYPNPSNGRKVVASMIGFENENSVVVTVTDVLGKVVYTASQTIGNGNNAEHEISSKLASGIYNVSCVGKNHKFTTKLVVE